MLYYRSFLKAVILDHLYFGSCLFFSGRVHGQTGMLVFRSKILPRRGDLLRKEWKIAQAPSSSTFGAFVEPRRSETCGGTESTEKDEMKVGSNVSRKTSQN